MIFMLFNLVCGLTQKHDHERVFEWFQNSKKKQMKSENYEICQYLMISYVEAVVKIWVVFTFLSLMMLTNRNISEEESESWEGCG